MAPSATPITPMSAPRRPALVSLTFLVAFAMAGLAASCASRTGPSTVRMREERMILDVGGLPFDVKLFHDERLSSDTLEVAPGIAWRGLVQAYASLGVPLQGANAQGRVITTKYFRAHHDFLGERISRWLDCGSSLTGEIATTYELTMRMATMIDTSLAGRSILLTALTATAIAPGSGTTPVRCQTRGSLEKRLAVLAREKSVP